MIKLKTLKLGTLRTNCYVVWDDDTAEGMVIDPADSAETIFQPITEESLSLRYVVATHGHFDHNLASLELVLTHHVPFAASPNDAFLLKKIAKSAAYWQGLKNEPALTAPPITVPLSENDRLELGQEVFTVLETPGHTPGSICLYHAQQGLLFSGDTLFAQAVGRTDLKYSSKNDLKTSIAKLFALPPATQIFPGHGRATTLEEEKKYCQEIGLI